VLRDYAARFTDDRSGWLFLTGDQASIRRVASEGFLLPVQDGDRARGDEAILHSSRFVLVDSVGRVRGTYEVNDPEAMLAIPRRPPPPPRRGLNGRDPAQSDFAW
jgi:protein SCO1/2